MSNPTEFPKRVELVSQSRHHEWQSAIKDTFEWDFLLFDRKSGKLIVDPPHHYSAIFGSVSQYHVTLPMIYSIRSCVGDSFG
jgi:hypothetical protein